MKSKNRHNGPQISILLPVFNEKASFLETAVRSILAQSFTDYELLLLDDGSSESETKECLRELSRIDDRVRLVAFPHSGLTRVLNQGLSLARGEFVARQDSDDWSVPERLQSQIERMRMQSDLAVLGTNYILHREDGEVLWPSRLPCSVQEVRAYFEFGNPFCHGSVLMRRSVVEQLGGYRESFVCAQDYDLFWRISEKFAVANLSDCLYMHRRTFRAVSLRRRREQLFSGVLIRALARMRKQEGIEDLSRAQRIAEEKTRSGEELSLAEIAHAEADEMLISGYSVRALLHHGRTLVTIGFSIRGVAKTGRAVCFALCPRLRSTLFGRKDTRRPDLSL